MEHVKVPMPSVEMCGLVLREHQRPLRDLRCPKRVDNGSSGLERSRPQSRHSFILVGLKLRSDLPWTFNRVAALYAWSPKRTLASAMFSRAPPFFKGRGATVGFHFDPLAEVGACGHPLAIELHAVLYFHGSSAHIHIDRHFASLACTQRSVRN